MTLKFKALLYRYTGIYLAHAEENDYLTSKECWKAILKQAKHPKNDMSMRNIQGLTLGLWQADHGFTRMYVGWFFKKPRFFWRTIGWIKCFFSQFKLDIQKLFRNRK